MVILKASLDDLSVLRTKTECMNAGFIKKLDVRITAFGSFITTVTGIDILDYRCGRDSEFYDVKKYLTERKIITSKRDLNRYCEERGSDYFRIDSPDRVYILERIDDDLKTFSIYSFRHDLYSLNEMRKRNYACIG